MKIKDFFEKHKFCVLAIMLVLAVLLMGIGFMIRQIRAGMIVWWMTALLIGSVAFIGILAVIIKKRWFSLQVVTAIILSVLSVLYLTFFTPTSVPDEHLHYRTAYHYSNQMLFKFNDEKSKLQMRAEDFNYMQSISNALSSTGYDKVVEKNYVFATDRNIITTHFGYMENKGITYIASAMGISLARIAGLSGYWTFQLGRLFNYISFIAMVFFAIKMMPFGKIAIAAISLIPINLHIMASVSYDVFTFGGIMLIFAYIMKLMYGEGEIGWKQLVILAVAFFAVIPQKVIYIGVAALVLLLPKEKFKTPKLHLLFKCLLIAWAAGSILLVQMGNASKLTAETVTNSQSAGFSIQYILTHKKQMLAMLFDTFNHKSDFYLKSMFAFFGYFQMEVPWYLTVPMVCTLLLAFMKKEDEEQDFSLLEKIYAGILFILVFLCVEMLLLIDHTPMGSLFVEGVQGRYFIPALPLVFLVMRNNMITVKNNVDGFVLLSMTSLNIIAIISCVSRIIAI